MGNVSEFMCDSGEETEMLADFFLRQLNEKTSASLLIQNNDSLQVEESLQLARKGVCCYDVLSTHMLPVDTVRDRTIQVPHAY